MRRGLLPYAARAPSRSFRSPWSFPAWCCSVPGIGACIVPLFTPCVLAAMSDDVAPSDGSSFRRWASGRSDTLLPSCMGGRLRPGGPRQPRRRSYGRSSRLVAPELMARTRYQLVPSSWRRFVSLRRPVRGPCSSACFFLPLRCGLLAPGPGSGGNRTLRQSVSRATVIGLSGRDRLIPATPSSMRGYSKRAGVPGGALFRQAPALLSVLGVYRLVVS